MAEFAHERSFDALPPSVRFRGYLWLAWCCARAGKKQADKADDLVRALCSTPWSARDGDQQIVSFSERIECLRFLPNRKETTRLFNCSAAVLKGFFEDKTIYTTLQEWAMEGTWERDGGLEWGRHLKDEKRDVFVGIVGTGHDKVAPYRGIPIIGYIPKQDGAVLVGFRDVAGINGLCPADRFVWLQHPPMLVQECPEERLARWWDRVRHEVNLATIPAAGLQTLGTMLFRDGQRGSEVVVENQVVAAGPSRDLIVVSQRTWLATATRVLQQIDDGTLPTPVQRHTVAGSEQIAQYMSNRPWVWSTYFGRSLPFAIVRDQDDDLLEWLVPNADARAIITTGPELVHPALDAILEPVSRLRLLGRPGTGKSSAIYHLVRTLAKDRVAVLLAPTIDDHAWQMLAQLLSETTLNGPVFVIDDFHRAMPDGLVLTRLLWLLRVEQRRGRLFDAIVIVAHWPVENAAMESLYARTIREEEFVDISLDAPSRAFVEVVFDKTVTAFRMEGHIKESFVKSQQTANLPVRTVIADLLWDRDRDEANAEVTQFREATRWDMVTRLETRANDCERATVQIADVLMRFRLGRLSYSILSWFVHDLAGYSSEQIALAFEHLSTEGWFLSTQGEIHTSHLPVGEFDAQWDAEDDAWSGRLWQRIVVPCDGLDPNVRVALLSGVAEDFYDHGEIARAIEALLAKMRAVPVISHDQRAKDLDFLAVLHNNIGNKPAYLESIASLLNAGHDRTATVSYVAVQLRKWNWTEESTTFERWVFGHDNQQFLATQYQTLDTLYREHLIEPDWHRRMRSALDRRANDEYER